MEDEWVRTGLWWILWGTEGHFCYGPDRLFLERWALRPLFLHRLVCPEFPPSLPLPPPHSTSPSAPPSLLSFSHSAPPTGQLDMPSVFGPSAPSYTEDPLSPPQTSVPPAPPRSIDTSAPPWLLPPSAPPEAIGHTASPGSFVHPAPPWSVVNLPAPAASAGSSFPRLRLHPRSHRLSLWPLDFRFLLGRSFPRLLLGLQDHRLSVDSSALRHMSVCWVPVLT